MVVAYRIDQQRLWDSLMKLAEIGSSSPIDQEGITRLSLTKSDLQARGALVDLMEEVGLDVRIDTVGNIIGRWEGTDSTAPAVLTGSHIDTVQQGGIFDGALGVLGAIEAIRTLMEAGVQLKHSIEVVSFLDEEGTRFGTGYIGSKAMAGELKENVFDLIDDDGITYREAFLQANLDPALYKDATRNKGEIKAYIEMHIEQGKVLEEQGLSVGIVTDIQGPLWLDITITGSADHAGATPMNMRKDASLTMAEIILNIETIAKKYDGVGTVGKMTIEPGGVNIIPGKASFSVDLRHVDKVKRAEMVDAVYESVERACQKRNAQYLIDIKKDVDPTSCSEEIIQVLEGACQDLTIPTMKLQCGAGHDSLIMSKMTKMGMIFIRSKDGISHNPKEWSSKEDCATGTQVLLNTLVQLASK
ncbi:Zn-dependent hydrolase [Bacillus suaedae]|uniref:Zn-dependent hydrolase n=1 Tax=Halalkalibacter suaedae TaxID=2822140 RepID=A0A940WTG8_9BACI|nr:Zn-dependent hydrolase [Bacillus suaedae]MBP3952444.1 Zn-dependent hydrolase [Bacillus suaedae]